MKLLRLYVLGLCNQVFPDIGDGSRIFFFRGVNSVLS